MVDPNIKRKADDIRTKVYGREVRESLASGLEEMSSDVVENEGRQSVVENRQDSVESQWQNVVDETTDLDVVSAPEIIAARDGEENLKARLDKNHQEVTAQLAHNENRPYTVKNVQSTSTTPKPIVVFTFDDGAKEDIEVMKPIFDDYGYKFTTFIIAGLIGGEFMRNDLMDVEDLRVLYNDGHEIGSHTMTHKAMNDHPLDVIEYEMVESKNVLEKLGFEVNNFAYPYGGVDDLSRRMLLNHYRTSSLFMSGSIPNRIPIDKSGLHRIALGSHFDPDRPDFPITDTFNDYYKRWVDDAIENNRLTIFALHPWELVNDEEQMTYLQQTLQYCQDNDVDVMTLNEALNYFDNQMDFKVYNEDNTVKSEFLVDAFGEMNSSTMFFNKKISSSEADNFTQDTLPENYPQGLSKMDMPANTWPVYNGSFQVFTDYVTYPSPDTVRQWAFQKWGNGIKYRSAKQDGSWGEFVELSSNTPKLVVKAFKPLSEGIDLEGHKTVTYDIPNSTINWDRVVVANSKAQLPEGVEYTAWNNAGAGCKLQLTNTTPDSKWISNTIEFNIKEV